MPEEEQKSEDPKFSMKHIAEDLESIAGEEAALDRGIKKATEALRNTQEAESGNGEAPMEMFAIDRDSGFKMGLEGALAMSNVDAFIHQATSELADELEAVADKIEVENGMVAVMDPETGKKVTISRDDPIIYYRSEQREKLGKPRQERVLAGVSISYGASESERDGVMDEPYKVTISREGYSANFGVGNFRLDLNDQRNPRNWGPERMKKHFEDRLKPLLDLPRINPY